jgi:hypothetical protein
MGYCFLYWEKVEEKGTVLDPLQFCLSSYGVQELAIEDG